MDNRNSFPRRFFPEVESLRGLAALAVMLGHYKLLGAGWLWRAGFSSPSDVGLFLIDQLFQPQPYVMLFFTISGFALGVQLKNQPVDSLKTYLGFVIRRATRMLPMMWAALLLALVLFYKTSYITGNIFAVFVKSLYFEDISLDAPIWSIGAEMACSLAFPLLYAVSVKSSLKANIVILLLLMFVPFLLPNTFRLEYLAFFQAGLIVGFERARLTRRLGGRRAVLIGALALAVWLLAPVVGPALLKGVTLPAITAAGYRDERTWMWLETPACMFILILAISDQANLFTTILRAGAARHLGRISYSLYLLHYVIGPKVLLTFAGAQAAHPLLWAPELGAAAIASLILANLAYKYIEAPGTAFGRQLVLRWRLARPAAPRPAPAQA